MSVATTNIMLDIQWSPPPEQTLPTPRLPQLLEQLSDLEGDPDMSVLTEGYNSVRRGELRGWRVGWLHVQDDSACGGGIQVCALIAHMTHCPDTIMRRMDLPRGRGPCSVDPEIKSALPSLRGWSVRIVSRTDFDFLGNFDGQARHILSKFLNPYQSAWAWTLIPTHGPSERAGGIEKEA